MLDYVVVGGAQAGLSIAYHLKIMEKKYVVIDGEKEIGASWLNRWDSLKLFTPTVYNLTLPKDITPLSLKWLTTLNYT